MRVMPKGITNHPGVLETCLDDDITDDCKGGYRADVILKEGWHFAGLDNNAPAHDEDSKRRMGFFNTLKDFMDAKPTQYTAAELEEQVP